MKTKLLIAAATIAGALVATYMMKRKQASRMTPDVAPPKKSHHITNVFAHAKQQAV